MSPRVAAAEQDLSRLTVLLGMLTLQTAAVLARPALIGPQATTHWLDLLFLAIISAGLRALSRSGPLLVLALVLGLGASGLGKSTLAVNAGGFRCTYDAEGRCVDVAPCYGDDRTEAHDDCLSENREHAWSSPIFVRP